MRLGLFGCFGKDDHWEVKSDILQAHVTVPFCPCTELEGSLAQTPSFPSPEGRPGLSLLVENELS